MDLVQDLKPRNIGPAEWVPVTSIDVVNDNPDIMYLVPLLRIMENLHRRN